MRTHGKYGAVKTSSPKKLRRVSGLRRDQMYTSVELRADPKKGIDRKGESVSRIDVANSNSQLKCAGERPADSSSRRE